MANESLKKKKKILSKRLGKKLVKKLQDNKKNAKMHNVIEKLTTPLHNQGLALKDSFKIGTRKRFDKLTPAQKKAIEKKEKVAKRRAAARKVGKAISKPITKILKKVKKKSKK